MNELYHYGVPGMKWGVRRAQQKIDKYRKKARQYDKYSKEYAKTKSQKYEARAQKIETKVKTKAELKASIERGKQVYKRISNNSPYDPEKHRTIYDALNKKDAADYRAYQKDFNKKEMAVILAAMSGVTVAMLMSLDK